MAARAGQQCPNTLLHLVGGLIGECDRQEGFGGNALLNQVRDAVSDDARLACSGARQHQHRPFGRQHGFALPWIEVVEKIHRVRARAQDRF